MRERETVSLEYRLVEMIKDTVNDVSRNGGLWEDIAEGFKEFIGEKKLVIATDGKTIRVSLYEPDEMDVEVPLKEFMEKLADSTQEAKELRKVKKALLAALKRVEENLVHYAV